MRRAAGPPVVHDLGALIADARAALDAVQAVQGRDDRAQVNDATAHLTAARAYLVAAIDRLLRALADESNNAAQGRLL